MTVLMKQKPELAMKLAVARHAAQEHHRRLAAHPSARVPRR